MESVVYKTCIKCDKSKSTKEFHKHNTGSLGVRPDCKKCVADYSKEYRYKNKEIIKKKKHKYQQDKPEVRRKYHLKKEYGITLEQYNIMFINQDGKCKICKADNVQNTQHKHLHVDHCHKTGKIRGLLCGKCNSGIAHFRDNLELLQEAINYLSK